MCAQCTAVVYGREPPFDLVTVPQTPREPGKYVSSSRVPLRHDNITTALVRRKVYTCLLCVHAGRPDNGQCLFIMDFRGP